MGIAFITAKAASFEHQTEAEYEQRLASENIFSGLPENVTPKFRCRPSAGEMPSEGLPVLLRDTSDCIEVFHMNEKIGLMMSPDASELRVYLHQLETTIVAARVVEVQTISNIFLVQLDVTRP
jgi:hypothetical protein